MQRCVTEITLQRFSKAPVDPRQIMLDEDDERVQEYIAKAQNREHTANHKYTSSHM